MDNLPILAYPSGLFRASDGHYLFSFYGIVIVLGACLCLFLANYHAHKDGYDWTFFNTVFIIAFPAGILGARIWYEIATVNEVGGLASASSFLEGFRMFWDFRNGGLAIQGGAILGVLAGVLYVFFRRQGTPILKATDYAVPTILIGQAIGRWGNFFNQEVFGHAVTREAWSFLPGFILNNMTNGTTAMDGAGDYIVPTVEGYSSIVAPLFLTESIINLLFFVVILFVLPAVEGRHYRTGDTTFSYFIAYGLVRFFLEPLRNPIFIMGVGEYTDTASRSSFRSYGMAIAFIVTGVVLIFLNHLIRGLQDKGLIRLPERKVLTSSMSVRGEKTHKDEVETTSSKTSDDMFDLSALKARRRQTEKDDKEDETHDRS